MCCTGGKISVIAFCNFIQIHYQLKHINMYYVLLDYQLKRFLLLSSIINSNYIIIDFYFILLCYFILTFQKGTIKL